MAVAKNPELEIRVVYNTKFAQQELKKVTKKIEAQAKVHEQKLEQISKSGGTKLKSSKVKTHKTIETSTIVHKTRMQSIHAAGNSKVLASQKSFEAASIASNRAYVAGMTGGMVAMIGGLKTMAIAFIAMKALSFISNIREQTDELYKTAKALDLNVNKLRAYKLAWSEAGVESKTTTKILSKVQELLQKAELGDASAIRFLTESGIDPFNDSLETTIEKLQDSGNASLIFAGKNLLAFNKITAAGADVNQRLHEMGEDGLLFTNESGEAFQNLNDKMAEFEEKIVVFLTNIMGNEDFIKGLESLLEGFTEIFETLTEGEDTLSLVDVAMKMFAFSMKQLVVVIKAFLIPLKLAFELLAGIVTLDFKRGFKALVTALGDTVENTIKLVKNTGEFYGLIEEGKPKVEDATTTLEALKDETILYNTVLVSISEKHGIITRSLEGMESAIGKSIDTTISLKATTLNTMMALSLNLAELDKGTKAYENIIEQLKILGKTYARLEKGYSESKASLEEQHVLRMKAASLRRQEIIDITALRDALKKGTKAWEDYNDQLPKEKAEVLDFAGNEAKKIQDLRASILQTTADINDSTDDVYKFFAVRNVATMEASIKNFERQMKVFKDAKSPTITHPTTGVAVPLVAEGPDLTAFKNAAVLLSDYQNKLEELTAKISNWEIVAFSIADKTSDAYLIAIAKTKELAAEVQTLTDSFKPPKGGSLAVKEYLDAVKTLEVMRDKVAMFKVMGEGLDENSNKAIWLAKKIKEVEEAMEDMFSVDSSFSEFYEKWNEVIAKTADFIQDTFELFAGFQDNKIAGYEQELELIQMAADAENKRWANQQETMEKAGFANTAFAVKEQKKHEAILKKKLKAEEEVEAKILEAKSTGWVMDQIAKGTQTLMNTAQAIMAVWAAMPLAAPFLIPLVGAMGAVQLATIASQSNPYKEKKAMGGWIQGQGFGDSVGTMLTPGEFVVNRTSARENAQALEDINSGAAREGGKSLTIAINIDGNLISSEDWVKEELIPQIQTALDEGHELN